MGFFSVPEKVPSNFVILPASYFKTVANSQEPGMEPLTFAGTPASSGFAPYATASEMYHSERFTLWLHYEFIPQ